MDISIYRKPLTPSTRDCCAFGRIFAEEHDDAIKRMSIREAMKHFNLFPTGPKAISKNMIETHRKCLLPKLENERVPAMVDAMAKPDAIEAVEAVRSMSDVEIERDQRVMFVAKLVEMNMWEGLKTVRQLRQKWGVAADKTIYRYMNEAQARLEAGRGGILFGREVSIRRTASMRDKAEDGGDIKAAILAQKHLDALTGALTPPAVQINNQINVVASPLFQQIFEEIADELQDFPEAMLRVERRLERAMRQLGSPSVIDVDAVDA